MGGEFWCVCLGFGLGWILLFVVFLEYIVVDFGELKVIIYIEMEGDFFKNYWLKYFFLDYRMSI